MKRLILITTLYVAAIIGEVTCIVKFFRCDFKESYKAEMVYAVGACTGLGAVIGYMDFGK
jgi:hypothetical protein